MNEGKGKIWFLRGGLFAKYVFALVGLVVFVLAINGAMETWISYRATRTSLTDGMSEKAEATAKRIEQSMAEMERQINWVTRASATKLDCLQQQRRATPRRLCAAAEHGAFGEPALLHLGAGPRAASPVAPCGLLRQQCRFLPRRQIHRDPDPRHQPCAGVFSRPAALHLDRVLAFRLRRHGRRNRSCTSSPTISSDAQVGRSGFAYVVDARGKVLASSAQGPRDRPRGREPAAGGGRAGAGRRVRHPARTSRARRC